MELADIRRPMVGLLQPPPCLFLLRLLPLSPTLLGHLPVLAHVLEDTRTLNLLKALDEKNARASIDS